MSQTFKVLQGDIAFNGEFSDPVFGIFRDTPALHGSLHHALGRFGLRLNDIKPERGDGSLGDLHLACTLLNYATAIRVRYERVEVACWDTARVSQAQFEDLAFTTLETVGRHVQNVPYKSYVLAVNLHGRIPDVETKDFLARFTTNIPKTLGPSVGSGVVMYFGAEAQRLTSYVTLDLSGAVAGALYLRVGVVWDASKMAIRDMSSIASEYFVAATSAIGLDVERQR